MSNSSLVSYTKLSPHHSGKRNHAIDTITIHCMAGDLSVESCGQIFMQNQASSNYGIGSDGRIALYVDEANRSWCTSSSSNDNRAVTIEVANTVAREPYPVSAKAYASLINLLVDICQRNGIKQLLWRADKSLIGQVDKQNMTVHRWFAAKSCPGEWLYEHHGQIADAVNARLGVTDVTLTEFEQLWAEMRKSLQTNDASQYSAEARAWAVKAGIVQGAHGAEFNGMWQDVLTREQMVVMLYRFMKAGGGKLAEDSNTSG